MQSLQMYCIVCLCNRIVLSFFASFTSGQVDRGSATEAVDSGSIFSRVKLNNTKIGIHGLLLDAQ